MSWSINIGTIAGTVVRIHITFVLFLGWIFLATYAAEGPGTAFASLLFMVLLFACILSWMTARRCMPCSDWRRCARGGAAYSERAKRKASLVNRVCGDIFIEHSGPA
jgi:hypothetical protein